MVLRTLIPSNAPYGPRWSDDLQHSGQNGIVQQTRKSSSGGLVLLGRVKIKILLRFLLQLYPLWKRPQDNYLGVKI